MWPIELARSSADLFALSNRKASGGFVFSVYRDLLTLGVALFDLRIDYWLVEIQLPTRPRDLIEIRNRTNTR